MRKKKKSGDDVLSSLPDELLVKILSYARSYKQAVKCSILCRRWRYLYTKLQVLYLSEAEILGNTTPQNEIERRNLISKTVASALFRHRANVKGFYLKVNINMSLWDWCLHFVAHHPIRHVNLWSRDEDSWLQEFPFRCESLVSLTLTYVQCIPLSNNIGFPRLEACHLKLPNHDYYWFNEFFPRSPRLHHCVFEAPFPSQDSPFTFLSPNLRYFVLRPLISNDDSFNSVVEIIVEAPRLSKLFLDCNEFDYETALKVKSSELRELSVKHPNDPKDWLPSIECHGTIWNHKLLLKGAHWNASKELTYLSVVSGTENGQVDKADLSAYYTLRSLELSEFKIYPFKFWEILCHLPMLQSLTLSMCDFEDDDYFNLSKDEDADFEVSNMYGVWNRIYKKKKGKEIGESMLHEVNVIVNALRLSGAAREMVQLLWEKSKFLRKLTITLVKQGQLNSSKYLEFFWRLLSDGDSLIFIKDNSSETVFQLIKKDSDLCTSV